jgi:glucokinase
MFFDKENLVTGVHPVFGEYSIGEFTEKDRSGDCTLLVDIGGTKTIFAVFQAKKPECFLTAYFKSGDKELFIKQFEKVIGLAKERSLDIKKVAIGVAGPVVGNKNSFLTNLKWQLNSDELDLPKGVQIALFNDFEAVGYGIQHLDHSDLKQVMKLNRIEPSEKGVVAAIGPGTGLGMSLISDGKVLSSEGGHSGMIVRTEEELRLVEFLKKLMKIEEHPGWEAVVSGPGIVNIYRFVMQDPKLDTDPAWITSANESGARTATSMFVEFLARAASDLALESKPTGGLYLAGGIVPKIKDRLKRDFMETFLKNYRKSIRAAVLEKVPVFVVLEQRTTLLGLFHLSASQK